MSITATSAARSRSTRSGSVTPNTARQITSKVSARMRSRMHELRRPARQRVDLALGDLADHLAERAAPREPWNGGSSSLRWRRCSGPSSTSTECAPSTGGEGRVRLAGAQVGLVAGEQLADRLRVGDVDAGAEDRGSLTVNTSP